MNLESGDDVERGEVAWIRATLPEYEEIWSRFVGHDGHGKPLKIVGFSADAERARESFYQAHYTLLICLLQLRNICAGLDAQQAYIPDPTVYLAVQRELTSFLAYVGQARDMFKMMDSALGFKGEVWTLFQDLYQRRCNFLHGSIPAQRLEDGILMLPVFAGKEKRPESWHNNSHWSDANSLKFNVAPDQLSAILRELIALSRSGLSMFLHRIRDILSAQQAYIEPDPQPNGRSLGNALSGVYYYSAHSC